MGVPKEGVRVSAAVAEPTALTGSPAEFVARLSPDDKHDLFLALLREALALHGDTGLLLVDDEQGEFFGYYVPPKAADEIYRLRGPQLTEEQERELDERFRNRDRSGDMTLSEAAADFRRQAAELLKQRQQTGVGGPSGTATASALAPTG